MRLVSQGVLPLSDGAWELVQCCWVPEAMKRPKIKDVTEMMTGTPSIRDGCPLVATLCSQGKSGTTTLERAEHSAYNLIAYITHHTRRKCNDDQTNAPATVPG